jgi:hypothetical protein
MKYAPHAATSNGLISKGPIFWKIDNVYAIVVTKNAMNTNVTVTEP